MVGFAPPWHQGPANLYRRRVEGVCRVERRLMAPRGDANILVLCGAGDACMHQGRCSSGRPPSRGPVVPLSIETGVVWLQM